MKEYLSQSDGFKYRIIQNVCAKQMASSTESHGLSVPVRWLQVQNHTDCLGQSYGSNYSVELDNLFARMTDIQNIATIVCIDSLQDMVVYYIDQSSANATEFFSLNQRTGVIMVIKDLVESRPAGDTYSVSCYEFKFTYSLGDFGKI